MKKVLVLDDGRGDRAEQIKEVFSKKDLDAAVCGTSNDFMTALCTANFETVYINAATWKKGRCVYEYFDAGRRLSSVPAVFYNVEENYIPAIAGRHPHEEDRVFVKPSDAEMAVDAH